MAEVVGRDLRKRVEAGVRVGLGVGSSRCKWAGLLGPPILFVRWSGFGAGVPPGLPGGVAEPANGVEHGGDGGGHVGEVDGGDLVGGLVVVLVESEAGDGLGDDTEVGEVDVVGALEEVFGGVRIVDEVSTVSGELWAEVGAIEACEPEGSGGNGGVGAADHFELEVGDDGVERERGMLEEGASPEAAKFFRPEEGEGDGAAGVAAGGEDVGEGEDCSGSGCVVVGSVVDAVRLAGGGVGDGVGGDSEVVEVRGEEDDFVLEDGV